MDRLIYTAMTGANAAANRQAILANNLANASTNGFRAELEAYRAVPVNGDGASTRVFALEASDGFSDAPGPAVRTDRNLDVMATGSSWLTVQGLDGNEAYTRNGQFEINSEGTLVTGNGLPVLSTDGSPLTIPAGADVSIANDGTISAKVGSQPANSVGKLKVVTPTTDDPLQRGTDGLFHTTSGDPLTTDDNAKLQVGTLEGSNVNTIETIVGMIQTARQFESQMKLLTTAESNDRAAQQLIGLQG